MLTTSYNFAPGRVLARKYEVLASVGRVREGELYMLSECATGIERTAKFFYPHANPGNRVAAIHAQKLHRLRHCPILLQYRTQETITVQGAPVTFLVSDFVRGELLGEYVQRQTGRKLDWFEALHLTSALARGMEIMHAAGESAGALRFDNIMVKRVGLGFQVKLMELSAGGRSRTELLRHDAGSLVRLFQELVGGAGCARSLPQAVKDVLGIERRSGAVVETPFRDAAQVRLALETMRW